MHGRLKVKTTAQQDLEKQKERQVKQAKYTKGMNAILNMKENKVVNDEGLLISAQLLMANPDALSLWNFRRSNLLALKCNHDSDVWQEYLNNDLKVTENCLLKNPKSYGAWHHRCWIILQSPDPPLKEELLLCNQYLQADERNFHCWDHRRFVVSQSKRSLEEELHYTQQLIEKNFSNYSAWHYRSKLLPIIYPPLPNSDCPHPVQEKIFIKELETVVTAVFTDPSDQSPWFFLRWLLSNRAENPKLIQVGILPTSEERCDLVLVFSQRVTDCQSLELSVENCSLSPDHLKPYDEERTVWKASIDRSQPKITIEVSHKSWFPNVKISLDTSSQASFQWISKKPPREKVLSDTVTATLIQVKDNCITLDEIESGNKWVLLTLVDVMCMLDVQQYLKSILSYLSQLEVIDPLRINFYKDASSKMKMESKLIDFLEKSVADDEFSLRSQDLTCLVYPQYMCSMTKIDLAHNKFRNDKFCRYFLACRDLTLDENSLSTISLPLRVERVSLINCGLKSISQLGSNVCNFLREINVKGNTIPLEDLKTHFLSLVQINN